MNTTNTKEVIVKTKQGLVLVTGENITTQGACQEVAKVYSATSAWFKHTTEFNAPRSLAKVQANDFIATFSI